MARTRRVQPAGTPAPVTKQVDLFASLHLGPTQRKIFDVKDQGGLAVGAAMAAAPMVALEPGFQPSAAGVAGYAQARALERQEVPDWPERLTLEDVEKQATRNDVWVEVIANEHAELVGLRVVEAARRMQIRGITIATAAWGIAPINGKWAARGGCMCGLAALLVAEEVKHSKADNPMVSPTHALCLHLGVDAEYLNAFVEGFDDFKRGYFTDDPAHNAWVAQGAIAAKELGVR